MHGEGGEFQTADRLERVATTVKRREAIRLGAGLILGMVIATTLEAKDAAANWPNRLGMQ